jgi:hypothetical protein
MSTDILTYSPADEVTNFQTPTPPEERWSDLIEIIPKLPIQLPGPIEYFPGMSYMYEGFSDLHENRMFFVSFDLDKLQEGYSEFQIGDYDEQVEHIWVDIDDDGTYKVEIQNPEAIFYNPFTNEEQIGKEVFLYEIIPANEHSPQIVNVEKYFLRSDHIDNEGLVNGEDSNFYTIFENYENGILEGYSFMAILDEQLARIDIGNIGQLGEGETVKYNNNFVRAWINTPEDKAFFKLQEDLDGIDRLTYSSYEDGMLDVFQSNDTPWYYNLFGIVYPQSLNNLFKTTEFRNVVEIQKEEPELFDVATKAISLLDSSLESNNEKVSEPIMSDALNPMISILDKGEISYEQLSKMNFAELKDSLLAHFNPENFTIEVKEKN